MQVPLVTIANTHPGPMPALLSQPHTTASSPTHQEVKHTLLHVGPTHHGGKHTPMPYELVWATYTHACRCRSLRWWAHPMSCPSLRSWMLCTIASSCARESSNAHLKVCHPA